MTGVKERKGVCYISIFKGRDENGKAIYEYSSFKPTHKEGTKAREKEISEYVAQLKLKAKEKKYTTGDKMTFSECHELWLKGDDAHSLARTTLEDYERIMKQRILPALGKETLNSIMAPQVSEILNKMRDEEGLTASTRRRTFAVINAVMSFAHNNGITEENVCTRVKLPKLDRKDGLHFFTVPQAKTFLRAIDEGYTTYHQAHDQVLTTTGQTYHVAAYTEHHNYAFQYKAFFSLAIYGGFRRGELLGLMWKDINYKKSTVTIARSVAKVSGPEKQIVKEPKTASSARTIRLPEECMKALKRLSVKQKELRLILGENWKGVQGDDFSEQFVFIDMKTGGMMDLSTPSHIFKSIIEHHNEMCRREEDKLPMIRLHDLRHTSATLLLANDVDIETVSHRLGHSKASVTLDVYGHWLEETDQKAASVLETLFA